MLKIFIPRDEGIFRIAAEVFKNLWQATTSQKMAVTLSDMPDNDMIVLGSDAVNSFVHAKIIDQTIPPFKLITGTDGYQLKSASEGKRQLLFIAGGRPRALLYGVYRFFELRANCRYFWDGDRVPKGQHPSIAGIDVFETPRFQYRGLRYFAHRSLNRFQAEHWSYEEWKHEIDWLLKKRLNLFMLRIGLDDLFQKAFPDIVHYPEGYSIPESKKEQPSYDDRDLFWSLTYRGELRKKVLAYARERDLLHPEDVGTMTHWYSRTPLEYLRKVNPDFLPQATSGYGEETGRVWDIRQDLNLEAYWQLTKTHIEVYGEPVVFHTIGLAERKCYEEHKKNQQMKLYAYRRIVAKLRENYPNAPLFVGTWDFNMFWTPQEVQELLKELDPSNTFILDYTSDTRDEVNNFKNWGIEGRFPWIFGIFHAYEPSNEIRGNYQQIEQRLPDAARDPMCRGLVFWPECSHSDTLMLDYFADNAWDPTRVSISNYIKIFCQRRYEGNDQAVMHAIWQLALPVIQAVGWPGCQEKPSFWNWGSFCDILFHVPLVDVDTHVLGLCEQLKAHLQEAVSQAPEIFCLLAERAGRPQDDFVRRDLIDLGRTVVSRVQTYAFACLFLSMEAWRNGDAEPEKVLAILESLICSATLEAKMLASHEDYSMYDSLRLLEEKHETNPQFEQTLKANANNEYCRSYVSELFDSVYMPEMEIFADWIRGKLNRNDRSEWRASPHAEKLRQQVNAHFFTKPLEDLSSYHTLAYSELSGTFVALAECADMILCKSL